MNNAKRSSFCGFVFFRGLPLVGLCTVFTVFRMLSLDGSNFLLKLSDILLNFIKFLFFVLTSCLINLVTRSTFIDTLFLSIWSNSHFRIFLNFCFRFNDNSWSLGFLVIVYVYFQNCLL